MPTFLFNSILYIYINEKQTIVIKNHDNFHCSMGTTYGSLDSSKTFSGTNGTSIYKRTDKGSYDLKIDEKTTKMTMISKHVVV